MIVVNRTPTINTLVIPSAEARVLALLNAQQVPNMPRATWSIGKRKLTLYLTIHYNGPKVPAFGNPRGELDQLRGDARWHMRPGAFGVKNGADGIQYHGGTLSDGSNWRFRAFDDMLWHCGNSIGNTQSIAWHIPIGGAQVMTSQQLASLYRVFKTFREVYGIKTVNLVGHMEWKSTDCPGTIQPRIREYRAGEMIPTPIVWYRTLYNANCREAPDCVTPAPIALHGTAITPAGTTFAVDKIIENGVPYNGNPTYVHRADAIGFYHMSVVTPASIVNFL